MLKDYGLNIPQVKWIKDLNQGTIDVIEQGYIISANANKRELVYNEDNLMIATKPYVLPYMESERNSIINPLVNQDLQ